ncbi:MAG TPA: hypothetical protein PK413_05080 [Thermoanaerobaculia bacterium]|nr:hypothetical protein [Thermoanaerobaculia bacterium]
MRKRLLFFAPLAILALLAFVALGGFIVLQLWNWLLPPLFGWHAITFWQALGLLALCRILFGGFGFNGSGASRARHRMRERWQNASPEERERFRQKMHERWGFGPDPGEGSEAG